LVVPLALVGTVLALLVRQMDVNMYTQIGVVLLIGMAAKTAILIVEFAKLLLREGGMTIREAAMKAAKLLMLLFVPSFYVVIQRLSDRIRGVPTD